MQELQKKKLVFTINYIPFTIQHKHLQNRLDILSNNSATEGIALSTLHLSEYDLILHKNCKCVTQLYMLRDLKKNVLCDQALMQERSNG